MCKFLLALNTVLIILLSCTIYEIMNNGMSFKSQLELTCSHWK